MSNRSVTFTGIKFENPFLLSSAPPTESESNILRAFDDDVVDNDEIEFRGRFSCWDDDKWRHSHSRRII